MHIRTLFYFFNYFFSIFATLEKRGKLVRVEKTPGTVTKDRDKN